MKEFFVVFCPAKGTETLAYLSYYTGAATRYPNEARKYDNKKDALAAAMRANGIKLSGRTGWNISTVYGSPLI